MEITVNNKEIEIRYNGDDRKNGRCVCNTVVKDWAKAIIFALNTRIHHCTQAVLDNIANITYVDDVIITYGNHSHYSKPAMDAMKRGIAMLKDGAYSAFLGDRFVVIQTIKALGWLGNVKTVDSIYSFQDLMDMLLEVLTCGAPTK